MFLRIDAPETALTPQEFVEAGAEGLRRILSTLLYVPGVCNLLLYGSADVGAIPLVVLLDEFYRKQGVPGVAMRASEFSKLLVDLFRQEVADVQDAFDAKCQPENAEFGIQFIDTMEITAAVKEYFDMTESSCNNPYVVTETACLQRQHQCCCPRFLSFQSARMVPKCFVGSPLHRLRTAIARSMLFLMSSIRPQPFIDWWPIFC
ncbi:hypothetical protein ACA910_011161 [Epithemia clementina (nom. ined.)]